MCFKYLTDFLHYDIKGLACPARKLGEYLKASPVAEAKAMVARAHMMAGRDYNQIQTKRGCVAYIYINLYLKHASLVEFAKYS